MKTKIRPSELVEKDFKKLYGPSKMTYSDARIIAMAINGDFQENSKQKLIFSIFTTKEKSLKELIGNSNFDQKEWVASIHKQCQSFFPKDVFCDKGFQDLFKQAAQVFFHHYNKKAGTHLEFSDFKHSHCDQSDETASTEIRPSELVEKDFKKLYSPSSMTYDDARVIAMAISGDFQENSKQKLIFSIFTTKEKSLKELLGNSNFDQLEWVASIYKQCQSFFPKDVFCDKGFQDLFKQAAQVFFHRYNNKQGTNLEFSDFDAVFAHLPLLSELDLNDGNSHQIIDTILKFSESEDSSSALPSTHPWKVAFYKLKALHEFLKSNKCEATMSSLQKIGQIKGDLSSSDTQSRIQEYLKNIYGEYRRVFQPTLTPKDLNALSKVLFIYVIDFISKELGSEQIDECRDQVIKYVLAMLDQEVTLLDQEVTLEHLKDLYVKAKEDLEKDIEDDSHFNDHSSQESSVYLKALAIAKFKGYLSNFETKLESAPELEPEPESEPEVKLELEPEPEPEPQKLSVAALTQQFESRPLDSDNEHGLQHVSFLTNNDASFIIQTCKFHCKHWDPDISAAQQDAFLGDLRGSLSHLSSDQLDKVETFILTNLEVIREISD